MFSLEILTVLLLINSGVRAFFYGDRPVDCLVSGWSEWSEPLEDGTSVRIRHVLRYPANGGSECPEPLEEYRVDCLVSEWSEWSGPVMDGTVVRARHVSRYPEHGGSECPELLQTEDREVKVTIEETATSIVNSFLSNPVITARRRRQTNIGFLRDLLLIFDESGSIGSSNFDLATQQIPRLLGTLCPNPNPFDDNKHKLAVISYSSSVREQFDFDSYTTTNDAFNAIEGIPYRRGSTNTAAAFRYAAETMFDISKGARMNDPTVTQEVLILTDGRSNSAEAAIAAAKELHTTAEVFALVIGNYDQAAKEELLQYVSEPIAAHIFSLDGFDSLTKLVNMVVAYMEDVQCIPFDLPED